MDKNYIIETKNLTKQYGSQKSVADLNIHVQKGRIYGLLGRNGAGKTTTMKMLLGLTKPTSGEVKIWGKSLQGNEKKLLPRIGSLIESPGFYPNLTATENLQIFATLRGVPNRHAIKDALDLVGLPYKDKKLFSQYSLGMKQRLAIALAVMHDPELLILDEPTTGLDPQTRLLIWDIIEKLRVEEKLTVFLTTHYMEEAANAGYVVILDKGSIVAEGTPFELKNEYVQDTMSVYGVTGEEIKTLGREYKKIRDGYQLKVKNTAEATRLIVEHQEIFRDYEVVKGRMDDVFLAVTGKTLGGEHR